MMLQILIPAAGLLLFTGTVLASPPVKYMVYSCQKGESLSVNQSLILELTKTLSTDREKIGHLHCAVDIIVQPYRRVFLHFISLDISDDTVTPDRFHIYDYTPGGKRRRLTPSMGLYGVLERPFYPFNTAGIDIVDYKSSGRRLRLDYLGKPTLIHEGFKILITSFKDASGGSSCGPGWFACPFEPICVPLSTRCDGSPNCGRRDSGDEQRCHPLEHVVTNVEESVIHVAVTGVAAFVVFLIVVVVVYFVVRRINQKRFSKRRGMCLLNGTVATFNKDEDTARLYAPPSYEDVVTVSDDSLGPPPEYSTVRFNDSRKFRYRPVVDRPPSKSTEVAMLHAAPKSRQKLLHDVEQCDVTSDSDVESDLGLSPDSGVSMTRDSESDLAKQEQTAPAYKLVPIKTDNSKCYESDEELSAHIHSDKLLPSSCPKGLASKERTDDAVSPTCNDKGDYQDIHCPVTKGRQPSAPEAEITV
ncbi:uncharacterized protein LOC121369385 [Gigantopelta aegis]|uniref:uncharacterized protein LOC121369385 n=1 Tax=Gigantopelta aegis TaxID=1735272 RepID=UPI001B88D26B|nr:uncharacterized protein LOC121369385 [Gigantopelta aegis]